MTLYKHKKRHVTKSNIICRLADDAIYWQKIGDKPPHPSYVSTVAKIHDEPDFSSLKRKQKVNTIRNFNKKVEELTQIENELDEELRAATLGNDESDEFWFGKELHHLHPNLLDPVSIHYLILNWEIHN